MSIVEERYSKWLNHENLAPQYKPVLEAMNAEEKNDAFYTTIEFGTAGMRGLLGPGTNRINIHTIRKATQGYANYINENNGGKAGIAPFALNSTNHALTQFTHLCINYYNANRYN